MSAKASPNIVVVTRSRECKASHNCNFFLFCKTVLKLYVESVVFFRRRQGTEDILLDDDMEQQPMPASNKRGRSEPRRDAIERERESQARAISKSVQQQKFQAKPQL